MNEDNFNAPPSPGELQGVLRQAVDAIRSVPPPATAPGTRQSRPFQAMPSPGPTRTIPQARRKRLIRRLATLSAAITIVVALGWLVVIDRTAQMTFAAVIQKVNQARSVTCMHKQMSAGTVESTARLYIREDAVRREVTDHGVLIFDRIRKKAIVLDERSKVATFPSLRGGIPMPNPLEELRNLKQENAQRIGEETIDGRLLAVYQLRDVDLLENRHGENDADIKLWVDPQTQLPVKLIIFAAKAQVDTYVEFSDFHWNEELDPSLFSLDIPDGYTVGKEPLVPQKPAEKILEEGENSHTNVLPAADAKVANLVSGYAPIFKNAVFVVKPSKGGGASSSIDKGVTNETPPRYMQGMGLGGIMEEGARRGESRIWVEYQYVGRGVVDARTPPVVDVYLISLRIGDQPEENISVIYSGGDKIVVDRPEIQISINQDE